MCRVKHFKFLSQFLSLNHSDMLISIVLQVHFSLWAQLTWSLSESTHEVIWLRNNSLNHHVMSLVWTLPLHNNRVIDIHGVVFNWSVELLLLINLLSVQSSLASISCLVEGCPSFMNHDAFEVYTAANLWGTLGHIAHCINSVTIVFHWMHLHLRLREVLQEICLLMSQ